MIWGRIPQNSTYDPLGLQGTSWALVVVITASSTDARHLLHSKKEPLLSKVPRDSNIP